MKEYKDGAFSLYSFIPSKTTKKARLFDGFTTYATLGV